MPLLFPCHSTYYAVVPMCFPETGITVDVNLQPNTDYLYMFTTPYGKTYADSITTDAEGKVILTLDQVPRDMLNPWLRLFQLSFYPVVDDVHACDPTTFTMCGSTYDTIAIRFIEGEGLPAIIGCQCEEV